MKFAFKRLMINLSVILEYQKNSIEAWKVGSSELIQSLIFRNCVTNHLPSRLL